MTNDIMFLAATLVGKKLLYKTNKLYKSSMHVNSHLLHVYYYRFNFSTTK